MMRLTQKDEKGNWCLNGVSWDELNSGKISVKAREILYGALCKLKDYEDTGLNPDGVNDFLNRREWIPCSERLPPQPKEINLFEIKCLKPYLVSVPHSDYPYKAFWNGKCFTDGFMEFEANAWMQLPKPYKQKGCSENE